MLPPLLLLTRCRELTSLVAQLTVRILHSKARLRSPPALSSPLHPVRNPCSCPSCDPTVASGVIENGWTDLCTVSSGPYHPAGQSGGHSLPGLAELSQSHGAPHQPPSYGQHPPGPSHNTGHSLPGIGQAMQHASPQSLNRERERDSREREMMERQRQQEEMAHREREQREREQMERQQMERHREQQQHHPVQSHTGSIPLHQPVASKVPNSIHGPNGLLSNLGSNPPNGPQGPVQSSSGGPGSLFGPQLPQHGEGTPRSYMQHPGGPPGQPMLGYNGPGQQIPGNVAALAQGQQPILNVSGVQSLLPVKMRCKFAGIDD